jgi:P27 family predicted phage terminase small subunit
MGGSGSGRKAKPPELQRLHGNPGRRPIPETAGAEEFGPTTCPAWLSKHGRNEWRRLAPTLERLGLLHAGNRSAFAGYCHAYSLALDTVATYRTRRAQMTLFQIDDDRKLVELQLKALETMRRLGTEFGLTPASSGRVPVIGKDDLSEDEEFLFGSSSSRPRTAKAAEPVPGDSKVTAGEFGKK